MYTCFTGNVFVLIRSSYLILIRLRLAGDLSEAVNLQVPHMAYEAPRHCWQRLSGRQSDHGHWQVKIQCDYVAMFLYPKKKRTFYEPATFTFRNSDGKSPWITSSIKLVCFLLAVFKDETLSQSSKCFSLSNSSISYLKCSLQTISGVNYSIPF